LTEGDSILLDKYDEFAFAVQSYTPELNASNEAFLDTVAQLITVDSTYQLTITGFYTPAEVDVMPGFFDNMGLARADAVRSLLIARGLDEDRITLDHGIRTDSLLLAPLTFDRYQDATPTDYAKTAYTFRNMTFSDANFEVNSAVFEPGSAFKLYADSVQTYLALHPERKLYIVGHTDSDASDAYNYRLGLDRSKSAKQYFLDLGVEVEIITESQGETQPVAPNDTPANKQKNRRVNFVIE
jgi:outer membrane protein OmpA-like peptidoglycan-associated protein